MYEKHNPIITRMANEIEYAIKGKYSKSPCAEEIVSDIRALAQKVMTANVKWKGAGVCWQLEEIIKILTYFAQNTRNYQPMSDEDLKSLKKIFDELNALYSEVIARNSQYRYKDQLSNKLYCIREIMCKNSLGTHDNFFNKDDWRDGMLFQNYEDLWKVIHRVNTEWQILWCRGFSVNVFYQYWIDFQNEKNAGKERTEEEKLKNFMALLDNKIKFVPTIQRKRVGNR